MRPGRWPRSPSPSCHGKAQPPGSRSSAARPAPPLAGQQKGRDRGRRAGLPLGTGRNARLPAGPHKSPGLTFPSVVLALGLLHGESAFHGNVPGMWGATGQSPSAPPGRPRGLSRLKRQPRSLPCPAVQVLPLRLPPRRRPRAEEAPEDVPVPRAGLGDSSQGSPASAGAEQVWLRIVRAPGGEGRPPWRPRHGCPSWLGWPRGSVRDSCTAQRLRGHRLRVRQGQAALARAESQGGTIREGAGRLVLCQRMAPCFPSTGRREGAGRPDPSSQPFRSRTLSVLAV